LKFALRNSKFLILYKHTHTIQECKEFEFSTIIFPTNINVDDVVRQGEDIQDIHRQMVYQHLLFDESLQQLQAGVLFVSRDIKFTAHQQVHNFTNENNRCSEKLEKSKYRSAV